MDIVVVCPIENDKIVKIPVIVKSFSYESYFYRSFNPRRLVYKVSGLTIVDLCTDKGLQNVYSTIVGSSMITIFVCLFLFIL